MGNSEVGHLTIGSGPRALPGPDAREQGDRGRLLLREPGARVARSSAASRCTCSGSSPTAACTRTSTTCGRCSLRAREDLDPRLHGRPRRLAARCRRTTSPSCPPTGSRPSAGRYYAMDRDQRWERTRPGARRDRARRGRARGRSGRGREGELRPRRDRRVRRAGRPRRPSAPAATATRAIFFNFRPDRARQLSQRLLEHGLDLTTMTRYRDDLDCPVAFAEQDVARDDGGGARRARRAPAPRRRDGEVRARHVLLQRRPRGGVARRGADPRAVAARGGHVRQEAGDVGSRARPTRFCAEIGGGYAFAVLNFANPDMVGHTGVIPSVVKAVETTDACLGRVVEAVTGCRRRAARHRRPRQRREDARGGRRQPYTAHTTNPVPLVVTHPGIELAEGGELSDLVPTALDLLGIEQPPR